MWNCQISSGSQFMNSISTYRRQCKENAENLYVTEGPMETTVTPTKRRPFATFTPNTQSRLQTAKPTYTVGMCIKPWHEGECSGRITPSKRPRQSDGICSTTSKKRLRRLWTQGFISIDGWTTAILHLTLVQKSDSLTSQACRYCEETDCAYIVCNQNNEDQKLWPCLFSIVLLYMLWRFYMHCLWHEHECSLVSQ